MTNLLSTQAKSQINVWLKKYPANQKRSAVLFALRVVQEENGGWLTNDLMDAVAKYLELPSIAVYEVATFYSMYDLKPVGRHKVKVCTSISCMLKGSDKIISHLRDRLGINMGETTPDGLFTLKEVECLAACGNAPAIQIDDKSYFEDITPEKIDVILDEMQALETANGK
ncbi:MAG: NADH-quinone oxidoreductase subunit NuoE [Gammaproteobacteria bacterium]|nr:NADH-quinone oxidoreductase subunit NuoE [Gammaproteobacteria bacterium]